MRSLLSVVLVLIGAATAASAAKIPANAWQTGTLKQISESSIAARPSTFNSSATGGVHRTLPSETYPVVQYTIDGNGQEYEAFMVLTSGDPRPVLTMNTPVKFAVVKSKLYIQDEKGKQFTLKVSKKSAIPSTP